jgi:hypothetical protein
VPPSRNLEKIMDLHNNDVGISIRNSLFYPTPQQIIDAVANAITTGQCWYLYDIDDITHEITHNTVIRPTNQ